MSKCFVEINVVWKKKAITYRFYGLGEWKVKDGMVWRQVNAVHVPASAMRIAAQHCQPVPPPILTEIEIARGALAGSES